MCVTSNNFENLLETFSKTNKITIYKLSFSQMKETYLFEHIKYYPSFLIYHDGEVVSYLDASNNDDIVKYKEILEFENWFKSYIKI